MGCFPETVGGFVIASDADPLLLHPENEEGLDEDNEEESFTSCMIVKFQLYSDVIETEQGENMDLFMSNANLLVPDRSYRAFMISTENVGCNMLIYRAHVPGSESDGGTDLNEEDRAVYMHVAENMRAIIHEVEIGPVILHPGIEFFSEWAESLLQHFTGPTNA